MHDRFGRPVLCLAMGLLLALGACGTLPPKSAPSSAVPHGEPEATTLGRIAASSVPATSPSGFRLLPEPGQALEAREQLLARAELTIDAQYYFIAGDRTGRAFLLGLEAAAARGVRVRLLVDDLHDAAIDPDLARLARVPGFEVRLFNPFCCARTFLATRFAASLPDLSRLDRRMHNKLLIADRSLAIAGGRNIADGYFARGEAEHFLDIDALMAGDIVRQLGSVFDRYWQADPVWPAQDILAAAPADPQREAPVAAPGFSPEGQPSVDVLGQPAVGAELAAGHLTLLGGNAYAFADPPSKASSQDDGYLQDTSVLTRAREALLTARSEVVIATPYLIPRTRGLAMMAHLQGQGVRICILTNGAATNDSLLAHAAYAGYRRRILLRGVELHELGLHPAASGRGLGSSAARSGPVLRLHAKAFVVDRQTVFIGSTNFDPRSSDRNTELGILVESSPLAAQLIEIIEAYRRLGSARVGLRGEEDPRERWSVDVGAFAPHEVDSEPGAGLLHWLAGFLLPLVSEDLL